MNVADIEKQKHRSTIRWAIWLALTMVCVVIELIVDIGWLGVAAMACSAIQIWYFYDLAYYKGAANAIGLVRHGFVSQRPEEEA